MPLPLLAALPAVFAGISAITQMAQGKKKLKALEAAGGRPEYETPEEVKQALAISQANYADPTMPGQQTMYDRNSLAAANAARAAIEGGGGISSLAGIAAAESQGAQNIGIAGANFQNQQELQYQNQLGNMANYQDQAFQINEFAPYTEAYNEGREQIGAGQQNLYGALGSIAKVGMGMAMNPTAPTVQEMGTQAAGDVGKTMMINGLVQKTGGDYGAAAAQSTQGFNLFDGVSGQYAPFMQSLYRGYQATKKM
jgi:hypothetical protein